MGLSFRGLSCFLRFGFFSRKFSLLASPELYEKKTPKGRMGSCGHLKLNGVSFLLLQAPSAMASVLLVLISSPDTCLNSLVSIIESQSLDRAQKLWCRHLRTLNESFISFSPTFMPWSHRFSELSQKAQYLSQKEGQITGILAWHLDEVGKRRKRVRRLARSWTRDK